jgi:hypothetical protein
MSNVPREAMKLQAIVISSVVVILTVLVSLILGSEKTGRDGAAWHNGN